MMFVLDYPKEMTWEKPEIIVPKFHTGHLGFLPDTPVNVALLTSLPTRLRQIKQSHPEIVISQFQPEIRQLAVLSVTLQDKIGVVGRLTKAVSSLEINIELQESVSINHLNEHHITLLLNMESLLADEIAAQAARAPTWYDVYRDILPVDDPGIVQLFETVVLHCFDVLVWRKHYKRWVPAIEIRSLPRRSLAAYETSIVKRVGTSRSILLPRNVVGALRTQMASSPATESLSYFFISDTDQRNLRVFLFAPNSSERLFHVAFYVNNVPGALATVLELVARAGFNIVTSLQRQHSPQRSVWEAVLEYNGEAEPPRPAGAVGGDITQNELAWLAEKIESSATGASISGVRCEIDLNVPRYPRRPGNPGLKPIRVGDDLDYASPVPLVPPEQLIDRARIWLAESQRPPQLAGMADLLDRTQRRLERTRRPTIFFSYPWGADHHAAVLRTALKQNFEVTEYNVPDGEVIVDEVVRRIRDADFFVAMWHHEENPVPGVFGVSTWMPFEYGVARTLDKPTVVIHSERLPRHIWNRIDSGVSQPEYSDVLFSDTVEIVVDYCRRKFRND